MEADAPWEVETEIDDAGEFDYNNSKSVRFGTDDYFKLLVNEQTMVARNNNY